jgi:hypothetical protein
MKGFMSMNHSFRRRRIPTEPGRAELVPRIKSTQMLVGEIVASVPTRDVLLYCSSHSAEGMHALREYTDEVHDSETTHALSKCLLVWRDGKWVVF